MNLETKRLSQNELPLFLELIRLFEDVFEMKDFKMPDEKYLQKLLSSESFFVFVALQENKVVGGLTSYILHQYYSEAPLAYIYDLAVKKELQYKGIGKKLISANNEYCKILGVEAVMVEADEVDGHAIRFYRSTGATGLKTVHFDYELK
jgi:ribosomal protein S18 acetylase RimI-like enzyme